MGLSLPPPSKRPMEFGPSQEHAKKFDPRECGESARGQLLRAVQLTLINGCPLSFQEGKLGCRCYDGGSTRASSTLLLLEIKLVVIMWHHFESNVCAYSKYVQTYCVLHCMQVLYLMLVGK